MKLQFFDTDKTSVSVTYDHRNTGTREDLLRARSEGRSLMARRRVTIVYRFSPREDLYARTQRSFLIIIFKVRFTAGIQFIQSNWSPLLIVLQYQLCHSLLYSFRLSIGFFRWPLGEVTKGFNFTKQELSGNWFFPQFRMNDDLVNSSSSGGCCESRQVSQPHNHYR